MATAETVFEEDKAPPLVERLAPSIPALFFVILALFASFVAQRQLLNGDGDLARHLRHGLYMLQHHTLIWRDPFSFTRAGQPFIPFEYGSQLLYALVYRAAGLAGVTTFAGLLIGATYALLSRLLLRLGVDPMLTTVTVFAAVLLGFPHWMARPHIITWLLIVLCFGLVEYRQRPPLWIYPLLFAFWANLHGGWLYGIALLGIYLVGSATEYWLFGRRDADLEKTRHLAAALPLSIVATLATPMGIALWRHLVTHLGDAYVLQHTKEFLSPDFHSIPAKVLLFILLGSLGLLIVSRRRVTTERFLIVLCGVWWALTSVRNLPLFGLTGITAVALHVDVEWRNLRWPWLERRRESFGHGAAHARTTVWVVGAVVFLSGIAVNSGRLHGESVIVDNFDPRAFPVAAVDKARLEHLAGNLFSDFTWGGYVLFAWPEQRVFIDGGTDFYGEAVMKDYVRVDALAPGWREILDNWNIELVLTHSDGKLAYELARSPGWTVWYCDSVALLAKRSQDHDSSPPGSGEAPLGHCSSTPGDAVSAHWRIMLSFDNADDSQPRVCRAGCRATGVWCGLDVRCPSFLDIPRVKSGRTKCLGLFLARCLVSR